MTSKRKRPMWPYLGILACLFALSLAAPRSWERIARRPARGEQPHVAARPQSEARKTTIASDLERLADSKPDLVQPSDPNPDLPKAAEPVPVDIHASGTGQPPTLPADHQAASAVRVTDSTDRLAMLFRLRASRRVPVQRPENAVPKQQSANNQEVSRQPSLPDLPNQTPPDWSVPMALLAEVGELASSAPTRAWATSTASQLHRLTIGRANEVDVAAIIQDLRWQDDQAAQLAPMLDPPDQRRLRRVRRALARRLDLWELVHEVRHQPSSATIPGAEDHLLLSRRLAQVATLVGTSKIGKAWRRYLLLDQLEKLAGQDIPRDPHSQRAIARRALVRLRGARLSRAQRRFITKSPIAALGAPLRRWAAEPVNIAQTLADLERYEQTHLAAHAQALADDCRRLAWSAEPELQELARRLERHYRGANLHVTISGELINRFMPKPEKVRRPVHDTILGADVKGKSFTTTRLRVRLLPDSKRFRLGLEAQGRVASDTVASSGPATFYSEGRTKFLARKMVQVTPHGIVVWPAIADASGQSDLLRVSTSYDSIPLIGSLVRSIATAGHISSHDEAMLEVEDKVASEARRRLDTEANRRIGEFESKFKERLFRPVDKLALNPTPLRLVTTGRRLVAGLRLAGDRQLAAPMSHPSAPPDSHFSVQLHLSAVNNAIDQFQLDGRQFTLPEFYGIIADKLDRPDLTAPEDLPENVTVRLAEHEAVRVSGIDGRIRITLVFDKIKVHHSHFSDLTVRAFYRPKISGMQAELVRDGSIQLVSNKRLKAKAQFVLRGVFAKVFRRNRPLSLLDQRVARDPRFADFEFTQFEIDDDWLALAVGRRPTKRDKVAKRPQ